MTCLGGGGGGAETDTFFTAPPFTVWSMAGQVNWRTTYCEGPVAYLQDERQQSLSQSLLQTSQRYLQAGEG